MKKLIKVALGALVLSAAAYTNSAIASLTSLGTDDNGFNLLIYDSVNNVTWYDNVYIASATTLNSSSPVVTINGVGTTGWTLPSISQLTTLHTELGSIPANWTPFETLPQYSADSFVSTTTYLATGRYERVNLATGSPISTGTVNSQIGDGLYYHAGQVAVPAPVPEPTTMIAGALLLLPFGASTLRILRKNRKA